MLKPALPPKLIGAGFMLLWALSISMAMTLAKKLSPEVPTLVVLFMRLFFGFLFFSPFMVRAGVKGFHTARPLLQLARVCFTGTALICTYYAYRNLPLALATSIGMTGPLFTTLFAMLLLRDHVTVGKWACIFFGYLGVLVMVRPHELEVNMAVWIELLANVCAALSSITVKVLSRTDSVLTIMLYTNTVTTFVAGILVYWVWVTPSLPDSLLLVAVGGFGLLSQYGATSALRYANPSYLAPFEYTRMCFAIPVGYSLFHEEPTLWVLGGSAMIIAATYSLTRLELEDTAPAQK